MESRFEKTIELRFNRTFMELKFENCRLEETDDKVLIVPLWNWNVDVDENEQLFPQEF